MTPRFYRFPFAARLARDETGVTAIVLGLAMSVVMGGAALAVDVGLWYTDQRHVQAAADSAAFTAAIDDAAGDTTAGITSAAKAVTAQYGLTSGSNGVTVTVNKPPLSGSHTATAGAVEVIVQKTENLFFSSFFTGSETVKGRAVGVAGTGGKYCVLALDTATASTSVNADVDITQGAVIDTSTCGVAINSPGADALYVQGATLEAGTLSIVGNYTTSNGGRVVVSGTTTTGASAVANPYSSLSVPSQSSLGSCTTPSVSSGGTKSLTPGNYCNLMISNNTDVTLGAGTYYISGGYFGVQTGSLTGTNVTIVLTGSGSTFATATISNGTTVSITAPSTGTYKGIAIMQDPLAPTTSSLGGNGFAGGANMVISGVIYFPSEEITYGNGTTTSSTCTLLVALRIDYTQGSQFKESGCSSLGISGIGAVATALVE